tara:strand:+ start:2043 stop:3338 length:1296 start_codon:yes stop_codon:yes gene_type:complete
MKLKNISKFIIVFVCALLINSSNFNNSYADDHTPQRKIINELKKEIIDLGAKPVKKKHIFYSLKKWTKELETQLDKLKKIDALKAEILKELEALGEKPLSDEAKELEADEEIIALRKLLEDVKAKKKEAEEKKKKEEKIAEEKKKKEAKISVAIEMLKDEITELGEEPVADTSDIDANEEIKALKKQLKKIKEEKKLKKEEAKKKAEKEKKEQEKKETRLNAIEKVKREILFLGETPMSEYEFTSEDEYIAALRDQIDQIKKLKEEEEFKINAEIPEWFLNKPESSETVMYARGSAISADLDNSEMVALELAASKLATQLQNRINIKMSRVIKEAGIDADITLKTEMERMTKVVVKGATIRNFKVYKTKMAVLSNGKYRTFIVIEFPVVLAYKDFIGEIDTNISVKAEVNKLKDTEAFKELEQYVAEFSGA